MKTNEVPEKVYIHKSQYWGLMANEHNITKNGNEYIRLDAFIEKACEWLKNNVEKYYYLDEAYDKVISIKNLNNDFKNYMKGE